MTIGSSSTRPLAQRYVLVRVGERRQSRRQEAFARQMAHRGDDARIAHLVGADLAVHHVVAGFGECLGGAVHGWRLIWTGGTCRL